MKKSKLLSSILTVTLFFSYAVRPVFSEVAPMDSAPAPAPVTETSAPAPSVSAPAPVAAPSVNTQDWSMDTGGIVPADDTASPDEINGTMAAKPEGDEGNTALPASEQADQPLAQLEVSKPAENKEELAQLDLAVVAEQLTDRLKELDKQLEASGPVETNLGSLYNFNSLDPKNVLNSWENISAELTKENPDISSISGKMDAFENALQSYDAISYEVFNISTDLAQIRMIDGVLSGIQKKLDTILPEDADAMAGFNSYGQVDYKIKYVGPKKTFPVLESWSIKWNNQNLLVGAAQINIYAEDMIRKMNPTLQDIENGDGLYSNDFLLPADKGLLDSVGKAIDTVRKNENLNNNTAFYRFLQIQLSKRAEQMQALGDCLNDVNLCPGNDDAARKASQNLAEQNGLKKLAELVAAKKKLDEIQKFVELFRPRSKPQDPDLISTDNKESTSSFEPVSTVAPADTVSDDGRIEGWNTQVLNATKANLKNMEPEAALAMQKMLWGRMISWLNDYFENTKRVI